MSDARVPQSVPDFAGDDATWFAMRGEGELDFQAASEIECDNCAGRPAWPYDWTPNAGAGTWEWLCRRCFYRETGLSGLTPWPWDGVGRVPSTIHVAPGGDDGR